MGVRTDSVLFALEIDFFEQNPTASALAWRRREAEGIAIFVLCGRSEETEWILLFFIIAGGLTIPYIGW